MRTEPARPRPCPPWCDQQHPRWQAGPDGGTTHERVLLELQPAPIASSGPGGERHSRPAPLVQLTLEAWEDGSTPGQLTGVALLLGVDRNDPAPVTLADLLALAGAAQQVVDHDLAGLLTGQPAVCLPTPASPQHKPASREASAPATETRPGAADLEAVLAAWVRHGQAAGHSVRTITDRAATIRRLSGAVDPLTASTEDLVAWLAGGIARARRPTARSSRATYRSHLRAFYSWLADTARRSDDPAARLPRPRAPRSQPRPLTPADVQALLAACQDPRAAQTRAYVVLACFAGLRVHEIAKIRGEDLHGDQLRVIGKGGHDSTIPVHPLVGELAATMPATGWWFPSPDPDRAGQPVTRLSVGQAITRAMRRADITGTPHACRHYYGTQVLASSGGNLRIAQRALRHADIRSTAIYTQVNDDDLRRAVTALAPRETSLSRPIAVRTRVTSGSLRPQNREAVP